MRFSWSVSCFSFLFSLVLFAAINGWTPTNFFWRSCLDFHLPRTLRFSLLSFQRVFSFSKTAFSFRFSPWFVFRSCYIFVSRCIFASGPYWLMASWRGRLFFFVPQQQSLCVVNDQPVGNPKRKVWWV
jgi:hypothetical protein